MSCNCCCSRKRTIPEPTDITTLSFNTSGNITATHQYAPDISAALGYTAKGDPANPIALCQHGFAGSVFEMRFIQDELAAQGYYAVAPALRGALPTVTALSTKIVGVDLPPLVGTYQTYMFSDLVQLCFALGVTHPSRKGKNVAIGADFGSSFAAGIVNIFKQLDPEFADVFKKVVILGNVTPGPHFIDKWLKEPRFELQMAQFYLHRNQITPISPDIQNLLPTINKFVTDVYVNDGQNPEALDNIQKFYKFAAPKAPKAFFTTDVPQFLAASLGAAVSGLDGAWSPGYYRDIYVGPVAGSTNSAPISFSSDPNLSKLFVPALYIFGKNDNIVPWFKAYAQDEFITDVEDASNSFSTIQTYISECSGHFPLVERPEEVNPEIISFLGTP